VVIKNRLERGEKGGVGRDTGKNPQGKGKAGALSWYKEEAQWGVKIIDKREKSTRVKLPLYLSYRSYPEVRKGKDGSEHLINSAQGLGRRKNFITK